MAVLADLIVAEAGDFLAVPNEAVIEEGDKQIVYVQKQPGEYVPQEIETGSHPR